MKYRAGKMKYRESFYKWGVTEEAADAAIDRELWYQLHDSERGNAQIMYVGFDKSGTLIEVGVELYPGDQEDWLFHARQASRRSKRMLKP